MTLNNHRLSGRLVLVVGPSGAGKDTLMDYAKGRLQHEHRIRFVRRVITRPASVGEDHEPADVVEFGKRIENGAFALHWEAHGLHYGIPRIIDGWLSQGHVVVTNGSRGILALARQRYSDLQTICITASRTVLEERLARRGREGSDARRARLARSDKVELNIDDALTIDNSGEIEVAGDRLVETLLRALPASTFPCRS